MFKRLSVARLTALFTRKLRFPQRERLLRFLFSPEYFRKIGSCEFTIPYDRDLRFRCEIGSHVEWSIFFKGYYDPDLSTVIKKLVKPGMRVMDVGANVGAYTLLMAERVGRGGKVIAFEPNPEVRQRFEYNVKLNKLEDRVTIFPFALSNKAGEFTLYVPPFDYTHRGISSLRRYVGVLTEEIKVTVNTLDGIFENTGLTQLDFLKIDAEGSDAEILRGGAAIIKRYLPCIIFEANYLAHSNAVATIEETLSWLKSLGYSLFTIGYFGRLKPCRPRMPLPASGHVDIVCIPGDGL